MLVPLWFKKEVFNKVKSYTENNTFGCQGIKHITNHLGYLPHSITFSIPNADMCYEALKQLHAEGYITEPKLLYRRERDCNGSMFIKADSKYAELKEVVALTNKGNLYSYGKIPTVTNRDTIISQQLRVMLIGK